MNPLVVDATDMIARAIEVVQDMEYNDGNGNTKKIKTIPNKEKVFNVKDEVLCFTWEENLYAVPYHQENYVKILEDLGYQKDDSIEVPFSTAGSFPLTAKLKWRFYMSLSRRNFDISKR